MVLLSRGLFCALDILAWNRKYADRALLSPHRKCARTGERSLTVLAVRPDTCSFSNPVVCDHWPTSVSAGNLSIVFRAMYFIIACQVGCFLRLKVRGHRNLRSLL